MAVSQDAKTTLIIPPQNAGKLQSILAADLLVVDNLVAVPSPQELAASSLNLRDRYARLEALLSRLFAEKNAHRGDKFSINADEFQEFSAVVAELPSKLEPGGSTADILTTLKHLHGDKVNIDFLGTAGRYGTDDNLIVADIQRNGIKLDPGVIEGVQSAQSFIITDANGQRTNITYAGNADQVLKPEMITDARVKASDAVLLPISLWSKFEDALPETLLQKALAQDKEIILTIPKQARFDYRGSEEIHKRVIPGADVIVGDEDEVARWYKTGRNTEQAIRNLHADMAQRDVLRSKAGKPPRSKPVTAFIKHKDDSATVLVAGQPPERAEIPAPVQVLGKKHTLGVDDAMYAGFIAGLKSGLTPEKAGEFAMDVAETKFLYDTARIPGPDGADKLTQERWQRLHNGMDNALSELGSAIGFAKTGVGNPVDSKLPRTPGQKVFDLFLYPLIANIGVFALSAYVTYHSNFNQNKANAFVQRSSLFKNLLAHVPFMRKNPAALENFNMVVWSFIDGSIMAPVVAAFESRRQQISRWFDDKMGTMPEDKSVYANEVHRKWWDVLRARATTFVVVFATYLTFSARLFPKSTRLGILSEKPVNSGIFQRDIVKSINGFVFDVPSRIISGWLSEVDAIRNWAQHRSGRQLARMAELTGTQARIATATDARYQIEGMVKTGIFELMYTSLCTCGLFFLGKAFGARRQNQQDALDNNAPSDANAAMAPADANSALDSGAAQTRRVAPKVRPEKARSYLDLADKTRDGTLRAGI